MSLLEKITNRKNNKIKSIAILIDPDKHTTDSLHSLFREINNIEAIHYIFYGGSFLFHDRLEKNIQTIKSLTDKPIVLFPGDPSYVSNQADALLALSVVSGRNSETLIGQLIKAAPTLKRSGIELLSTAYIMIDGGRYSTANYISGSTPIPHHCTDVATSTAIAAEIIGHQALYLEAGSGATQAVSDQMVAQVHKHTETPLIVGGGIRTIKKIKTLQASGADIIVLGNTIEENPSFLEQLTHL